MKAVAPLPDILSPVDGDASSFFLIFSPYFFPGAAPDASPRRLRRGWGCTGAVPALGSVLQKERGLSGFFPPITAFHLFLVNLKSVLTAQHSTRHLFAADSSCSIPQQAAWRAQGGCWCCQIWGDYAEPGRQSPWICLHSLSRSGTKPAHPGPSSPPLSCLSLTASFCRRTDSTG